MRGAYVSPWWRRGFGTWVVQLGLLPGWRWSEKTRTGHWGCQDGLRRHGSLMGYLPLVEHGAGGIRHGKVLCEKVRVEETRLGEDRQWVLAQGFPGPAHC